MRKLSQSLKNKLSEFTNLYKLIRKKGIYYLLPIILLIIATASCHINTKNDRIFGIREKIVKLTKSLQGIKYSYGGNDIDGFDCSGLVYYVYDSYGIKLPRTAKKQGKVGKRVKLKKATAGDVIVFKLGRDWHSGIISRKRNNKIFFIHAPNRRSKVREEELSGYWLNHLKYIIRLL